MVLSKPTPSRPTLSLRESECGSFSQLLAGAMAASPPPPPPPPLPQPGNCVTVRPKTVRLKPIPPPPAPGATVSEEGRASVVFKPLAKVGTRNPLSSLANLGPFGISHQQALAQVQAQAQVQSQPTPSPPPTMTAFPVPQGLSFAMTSSLAPSSSPGFNSHSLQKKTTLQLETKKTVESPKPVAQYTDRIQPSLPPISVGDRPSFDGYNWRKYGQKQVKGSEYPRSYYKCTHPNCPVKKKVERSHDGQVTEIVYKGEHNHLKPQPTRRTPLGANLHERDMDSPAAVSCDKIEHLDASADQSSPGFYADASGKNEKIANNSDLATSVRGLGLGLGNGTGTGSPEQSFGLSDDGEDVSRGDDEDDDEPDSKRRKKDKKIKDLLTPQRTSREPRIIVQTTDADILEDGFRWRKYGQKVVKGNPYPRSYYKCTSVKCTVRKHVERASDDPKAVITTYEGKHNHDAPLARNSNHDAAASSSQLLSGNGADVIQEKPIQHRLPPFARVLENTSEVDDRIHLEEVAGVPATGNKIQSHGGDMERAFGSDDNFAVSGALQGFGTEGNRGIC